MKKSFSLSILLIALFIFSCNKKIEVNTPKNSLLGSWKMEEIHYIYKDTTYIGKPITYGTILFTSKRYSLLYNPWTDERKAFKILSKPTDEEIKHAFQSIVFNSGSYIFTDSTITTNADMAKVPGFEGGKQFYNYNINNDKFELIMVDETYPSGEKPAWSGKMKVKFIMHKE